MIKPQPQLPSMNRFLPVLFLASLAFYSVFFWTEPMYPDAGEPFTLNRLQTFYNILLLPEQIWESWHGLSPKEREYSTLLGYSGVRDAQAAYLNAQNLSVLPINRLSVLLIAGFLFAWIFALGRLILRFVVGSRISLRNIIGFDVQTVDSSKENGSRQAGRLLDFGLSFLLGAASLGALVGCLGLLGHATGLNFYSGWVFWSLFFITCLAGSAIDGSVLGSAGVLPAARRVRAACFTSLSRVFCRREDGAPGVDAAGGCAFRIAFALAALFLVYSAMQPPFEFDVREYHLQAAKEFYQLGALDFLPHNVYANMPLGLESLSLASMCLAGDWFLGALAGKVVIALFALVIVLILYAAGRRLTGSWAPGALGALIFLSVPIVWESSTFGLVDVALGAYFLAVVYLVLAWDRFQTNDQEDNLSKCVSPENESRGRTAGTQAGAEALESPSELSRLFFLIGLFTGGAVAIKYTAVVFLAVPVLIWIGLRIRSVGAWPCFRVLTVYLAGILLVGGVWYAKNAVLIGNPVYPLAERVFGNVAGNGFTSDSLERWNRVHSPKFATGSELVRLGTSLSWKEWGLGTLFLPSLIGLVLFWPQLPRWARLSILFVSVYLVLWFFLTHRIIRFLLPVLPVVILPAGWSIWFARERISRIGQNLLTFLLATGLLSCFLYQSLIGSGINDYLSSLSVARAHPFRMTIGEDRILLWLAEAQKGTKKSAKNANLKDSQNGIENGLTATPQITEQTPILLIGDAAVFGWSAPIRYAACFNAEPMLTDWLRYLDPELAQTIPGLAAAGPESGNSSGLLLYSVFDRTPRVPGLVVVNWQEIDRYRHSDYGYCPWFTRNLVLQLVARGRLTKIPFNSLSFPESMQTEPGAASATDGSSDLVEIFREDPDRIEMQPVSVPSKP